MLAALSPERLALASVRRPWRVIAVWVVLLVAAGVAASQVGNVLTNSAESYVETDSSRANDLLEQRLWGAIPGRETVVIHSESATIDDPQFQQVVTEVTERLRALNGQVAQVTNTFESGNPGLVSESRHTTIIPVTLHGELDDAEKNVEPLVDVIHEFDGVNGFTVVSGGDGTANLAFNETAQEDLETAEIIGIPVALIILVVVFGAVVAAGIPIVLGLLAIAVAVGLSAIIGREFELSTFLVNFVTTMGLAVGIDYTLLIVQRVREERRNGLSVEDAIVKAGSTANRAVLFSGLTVIVALFGLVIVPQSIFRSLGVGAILVVAASILLALTLLPAVLKLLGDRINAIRIRVPFRKERTQRSGKSGWDRVVRVVMAHPVISMVLSAGLLIAASMPYFTMKMGWAGVSSLPEDSEAHRAFELLNTEFSAGALSPVRIVIDSNDVNSQSVQDGIAALNGRLEGDSRFGTPAVQTNDAGNLALIEVPVTGDSQSDEAHDAVNDLRDTYIPATIDGVANTRAFVTGGTAEGMDNTGMISSYTLPVFAFVLGLSFLILLVVFRSIVVPLKAIIMNLLSVGAAYGLMVLIFQHGVGNELFGFTQVEQIESWVPLFMFATLFGLSMDYHVFLLTRIREHFEHTGDNAESVAYGVRTTAGMITGAAAIMVAVFFGFASGQLTMFQQMGFGLAVAVLLDATIVRIVLVPATMELLGVRNWYFPRWLEWLPKVDVEGSNVPAPAREPVGALRGTPERA